MKIYFYIGSMRHGGAERVVANLATMLASREHKCKIITSYNTDWAYSVDSRVEKKFLLDSKKSNFIVNNLNLLKSLRDVLKAEQPDVLISFMGEPNMRSCLASLGLRHKLLLSVRNTPDKEYPGIVNGILANVLFLKADKVVFQTDDAKKWFNSRIRHKGVIIQNSVAECFYNTRLVENRSGIYTTGRLAPQKNHKLLITAYSNIADNVEDDLFICGSGEQNELKRYTNNLGVGDRVHFLGQIHNVPEVLKQAKLYVLSSDYEGLPNALMEAMAMGLPCISTDCPCGGPKLLFGDSLKNNLVPVGEVYELANKMLGVLRDESKLNEIGNLCKVASQKFRPSIVNDIWEKQICSLIKT